LCFLLWNAQRNNSAARVPFQTQALYDSRSCASGYGVTALSISIIKNMPDTDSPINFVVAPSLIDTKTKMADECSMIYFTLPITIFHMERADR
jgi:hypothetical protein